MTRRNQVKITDSRADAGWGIIPPVCDNDTKRRWSAFYATPWGYVEMEARRWTNEQSTWLNFIWQGEIYMRHFDRFYSRRYAIQLATHFAREVAESQVQP